MYTIIQYRGSRHILRVSTGHTEEYISYLDSQSMVIEPFHLESGFKYEVNPTSDLAEFIKQWQSLPFQTHLNKKRETLITERASYIKKFLACVNAQVKPAAIKCPILRLL